MLRGMGAGLAAGSEWRLFESKTQHFSVRYPPSWNRLATWDGVMDENILGIINFPNSERVEGVVIKKGGAEISVGGRPNWISTADGWIEYSQRRSVTLDRKLLAMAAPSPGGCTRLERVVTRFKMDDAYVINTSYYCTVGNRFYGVFLTNWEGDPQQSRLQDTALKIALSLRSRWAVPPARSGAGDPYAAGA
jgi:hypothetical protein